MRNARAIKKGPVCNNTSRVSKRVDASAVATTGSHLILKQRHVAIYESGYTQCVFTRTLQELNDKGCSNNKCVTLRIETLHIIDLVEANGDPAGIPALLPIEPKQ